jgi:RNA polymerase sigma-32 factor
MLRAEWPDTMRTALANNFSYLSQLADRYPTLEADEEVELARRVRDFGDKSAAERLARAHLRAVLAAAAKHRHYGVPVPELVAEGNCGLVAALRKFDPERGVRFQTYAKYWIRAYILAYVIRSSSLVAGRSGLVSSRLFFKVRRERVRMAALLGDGRAADEALARRLDVSVERLQALLGKLDCRDVSLDIFQGRGANNDADSLASADDPELSYFTEERNDVVAAAVAAALLELDPRERFIAERRLMAAPADELSLAEIARGMGISRERARQLEERAKRKLKRSPAIRGNSRLSDWLSERIPSFAEAG